VTSSFPQAATSGTAKAQTRFHIWTILLISALTFVTGIISPPHLMDDVDGAQGQIVRNMLKSGDWVTGHLDGVIFLDKAPVKYWIGALLYKLLGAHDWVARIPNAMAVLALCLLVYFMGRSAGAVRAGFYAALVLSTSIGLFLFTRIVIPDVILTLVITVALWGFWRVTEGDGLKWCAYAFWAGTACAVLLKGLIGVVFPVGIAVVYLLLTRRLLDRVFWKSMHVATGILLFLAIALPWHILAILRNPPYFDWSLHAGPHFGYKFRGFFWFYFINDQVLRFTNQRWPRDYNTVPRFWFWAYHLLWFFPWSLLLVNARKRNFQSGDRGGRLRLLCLVWCGFVLLFFTFSTTQEYYSMPIYPALALIIGYMMTAESRLSLVASRLASAITTLAFAACAFILSRVWTLPAPGDISDALSKKNADDYTLALAHISDLTYTAFAYLRVPLAIAAAAFLIGAVALWMKPARIRYAGTVLMLVLFFQAARLALVTFDPYLSSYAEADALRHLPQGTLIFNGQYYDFDAVAFYTDYNPLLLNGRYFNLEYGSYAPGAPNVFIDDAQFTEIWRRPQLAYVITYTQKLDLLQKLVGREQLHLVMQKGGKQIYSNQPVTSTGS
jgi:4-amino-4-deoxy-L-arabinose transferase-like glycosyltransferase